MVAVELDDAINQGTVLKIPFNTVIINNSNVALPSLLRWTYCPIDDIFMTRVL